MKNTKNKNMVNATEQKYRAKMVKGKKGWLIKGMLFSTLLFGGAFLVESETVQAAEWQVNSVEAIKATLKENQSSYTFVEGDTFYNIALAVNVKWETLMTANGFELGSQYSVPVGTMISFDGSKMTVTNAAGEVISETQLNNNDKIDTTQLFAGQATTNQPAKTNTGTNNKPNASLPITKPSTPSKNPTADKEEAESQLEEAEKDKEQVEKEKEEVEKELAALNESNNGTLLDLQAKRNDLQQKVDEAQTAYDLQLAAVTNSEAKVAEATTAQAAAQTALENAQTTLATAQANADAAQNRVNEVQAQMDALAEQATTANDAAAQAKLAALQLEMDAAQANLTAYQNELNVATDNLATAQTNYDTATTQLTTVEAELATARANVEAAQVALVTAETELNSLPETVTASTVEEAKKLQKQLADFEARLKELDTQITTLKDKIEQLDQQIAQLDQQADQSKKDFEEIKDSADNVVENLADETPVTNANDTANNTEKELPEINNGGTTTPSNEDKYVTVNVDEAGNRLTDLTGYVKVSESEVVKTVETLPNGNTITTYTTTVTYHKTINTDKSVTYHIDEVGNPIDEADLVNYVELSRDNSVTVETLPNGDTVTTQITTIVYRKVNNTDKHVTITIDEAGNVITDLTGYTKISESEAVKTVETLPNGDTVTTYTTTITYHKNVNTDKHVNISVDESGKVLTDLTDYEKVSESTPVKSVETLPNGDTITTYTTTVTYKKKATQTDPIIDNILSSTDQKITDIKNQVSKDDTAVSLEQARELTDAELTAKVAEEFAKMVQAEQANYNYNQTNLTTDDKVGDRTSSRAVEVMYNFDHARPENDLENGTYKLSYNTGDTEMANTTENISQSTISASKVNGDSSELAKLIAQAMFQQYIEEERAAYLAGNTSAAMHYSNIAAKGYTDMSVGVFVVKQGNNYVVTTTVITGNHSTAR
ncbi:hypothetical protein IGJ55_000339 [Enterococcus sp. AZ170]|uniref:LysM peptidoglycan-binding domain-containing protein n=1 Tax=Enterococcus sp. AZ170 TaxID=2774747 RepID=UPI003D300C86